MAKDLKTILAGVKSSKKEKMDLSDWEKSKDGQAFAAKHEIEKHADRVGNTDDTYKGKTKEAKFPKQKESVYESSKMKCESCGNMYEEGDSCGCGAMNKKGSKKLLLSGKKGLSEVLSKSTTAGETISDFVHSKNPKFAGKSTKERQRMALGAYYGMHPEKSKLKEEAEDKQYIKTVSPTGAVDHKEVHSSKAYDALNSFKKRGYKATIVSNKTAPVKEEADYEFDMARNELATAGRAIARLMQHLKGEGQLEAWVQSKITKGSDYLDTVADYLDSKMNEDLAMPMLEDGKKKKGKPKKEEKESAPSDGQVDLTSGNYPSGNIGDTGRV